MLHVVGVAAAVAPHVALDPPCRADVVVAAHRADVLSPGAYAHQRGAIGIGDDPLRIVDIDDDLRADRDDRAEVGYR